MSQSSVHAVTSEPERSRSSCEIKTSTRGTDITVKVYEGSPVEAACDEALREYFRVFDRVAEELMGSRGAAVMNTPMWRPKLGVYIACALSLACMAMFVWVVLR